jgi:hypothetical protein
MKNVHLLPTDKPSRLVKFFTNKFHLCKEILPIQDEEQYQNTYITSNDEEIKEGWILVNGFILRQVDYIDGYMVIDTTGGKHHNSVCKKIILTTDQDLIAQGVQAIDNEFLEWFVKNPSCEKVEVGDIKTIPALQLTGNNNNHLCYKIIIPQESTFIHN